MTQEQKRIKLAEYSGWTGIRGVTGYPSVAAELVGNYRIIPDYFNDLNAIHELEKLIAYHQSHSYMQNLHETMSPGTKIGDTQLTCDMFPFVSASAARKAEAIGKTLNLW